MIKYQLHLILIILIFTSCEKPPTSQPVIIPSAQQGGMFVLNEGGFNNGNASLSYYSYANKSMTNDVFYSVTNRHLGDVLQSMTLVDNTAYLVLNNSKKVEVIDATTFVSKGIINGFLSPRYLLQINTTKAYVSDLYDNNIAVVNLSNNTINSKISCPGATEQMLLVYNRVYVTNTLQKSIYVIDPLIDKVIDSIQLSYGPNSLVLDKNNNLWVLCSGNKTKGYNAAIYKIDLATNKISTSNSNINPVGIFGATKLVTNGSKDKLYWLNGDVQSISVNDTMLNVQSFIPAVKSNFYGLGVDPITGEVFVSDALDFVQQAAIYKYKSTGELEGVFKCGVITNGFLFDYR